MDLDAIVIGVGGMGSAAVYHLARRGARVLGLERFAVPHDRGSSHGATRIIRLAYAEDPLYVPLLERAYVLWGLLERDAGEPLLVRTGGFDIGAPDGRMVPGTLRSCAAHGLAHEVLDARAIAARFPGYRLPDGLVGVWQPESGYLLSERAIIAHVAQARALGADVRTGEVVTGWEASGRGVTVRTTAGVHHARRLIVTAGPWAGEVVPALAGLAVAERQVLLWTRPAAPDLFEPPRFPVFNMEAPEGHFYGFPSHAGTGFKIGKYHHFGERTAPDAVDREIHPWDEQVLRDAIRRYFPGADGPTLSRATCLFTNSPDEHFILDHLPGTPEVAVAAGFSGHGYKFCSVVGEIMADLALDGGSPLDLSLFRLARFAPGAPGR